MLVIIALLIVSLIYPQISQSRSYGPREMWITIALCFSFLAASLKTIPSILLERELNFKLLSTVDIIENISFYLVAVTFAFLGFGGYSYAIAAFVRSLLGLTIIYRYSSWPIGISFSYSTAKELFRYGIPFQLNSFIAMAKDRLSNLLVAGIIGRESFGLLAWSQKGPRLPLNFMDSIMKVTFPTFSRLQDDPELLKKSLNRSLYFIALVVFPLLSGISLIASNVIDLIPKYQKWTPALIPMYLFAVNAGIAAITTPLTNAFNAVGKISITTKFMIMWTILTWLFYPSLSHLYGYHGTAIATLLVGFSSFIVWLTAADLFHISIPRIIFHPTMATILLIISVSLVNQILLSPLHLIVIKIFVGTFVYSAYSYYFCKDDINWFYQQLKWSRLKK